MQLLIGSNLLVDQVFAQRAGETFLGVFNYASKLPNLIASVAMVITSSVLLPFFQERIKGNQGLGIVFGKKMALRLFGVAVLTFVFYHFSSTITSVLFERGNFRHSDVEAVSAIQKLYFLMAPITAFFLAYIRYLGTTQKIRKAMLYASASFGGVILSNMALFSAGLVSLIPFAVIPGYFFVICCELVLRNRKIRQ